MSEEWRLQFKEQLTTGVLSKDSFDQFVDGIFTEIDAGARRDEVRWGQAYRSFERWRERTDFHDYDGEFEYLRQWIDSRREFLLSTL